MEESRRPLKTRSAVWAQALARSLTKSGWSPNGISAAGLALAVIGAGALVETRITAGFLDSALLLCGAVCIQMRLLCNLLDGLIAIEGGRKARFGDLFNELPDRAADILFLAAAGVASQATALGLAAAAFAVLTAYVRAFGASLGKGQDFCGPFAKPQRMFLLTVGCVFGAVEIAIRGTTNSLRLTLWVIALGALLTAIRRVWRLAQMS